MMGSAVLLVWRGHHCLPNKSMGLVGRSSRPASEEKTIRTDYLGSSFLWFSPRVGVQPVRLFGRCHHRLPNKSVGLVERPSWPAGEGNHGSGLPG